MQELGGIDWGCRLLAHHLFHHPSKPNGVFDKNFKKPNYEVEEEHGNGAR